MDPGWAGSRTPDLPGTRNDKPRRHLSYGRHPMKIHIVGGGPGALYFASLMKKAWPQTRITVFERNRPEDTFGFGVVFSDETLDTFETYDRESYRAIVGHFAYWDDIEIHFRGTVHRIGGNGFCGCSRATLLKILAGLHPYDSGELTLGSSAQPFMAMRARTDTRSPSA